MRRLIPVLLFALCIAHAQGQPTLSSTRVEAAEWTCRDQSGAVLSSHTRQDKAQEACSNRALATPGAVFEMRPSGYRIAATVPPVATDPTPAPAPMPTPTPTPTPAPIPSACSGVANTAGGSDGMGGCFPGPDNTGVPSGTVLTSYTGSCTLSIAGTVIDSKIITCSNLAIRAANVTISKSEVRGPVTIDEGTAASVTIVDSFVNGSPSLTDYLQRSAIESDNITVLRSEVVGGLRGVYCRRNCNVRDSWIHGTDINPNSDWHAGGIRIEQGATLVHNTIACDWRTPTAQDGGCSADITGYPDFDPVHHVTLDGNLFVENPTGLGFCIYAGGTSGKPYSNDPLNATYIVVQNNVFQRGANGKCGTWGAVTDFRVGRTGSMWQNNKWSDGAEVNP